MGIRDTLNQNPRLTTGLTIAIIVAAFAFLAWQIWGGPIGGSPTGNVHPPTAVSPTSPPTTTAANAAQVVPAR